MGHNYVIIAIRWCPLLRAETDQSPPVPSQHILLTRLMFGIHAFIDPHVQGLPSIKLLRCCTCTLYYLELITPLIKVAIVLKTQANQRMLYFKKMLYLFCFFVIRVTLILFADANFALYCIQRQVAFSMNISNSFSKIVIQTYTGFSTNFSRRL